MAPSNSAPGLRVTIGGAGAVRGVTAPAVPGTLSRKPLTPMIARPTGSSSPKI